MNGFAASTVPLAIDVDDWLLTTLLGWATFLWRVVPRMTVDRGSVAVGIVSLVLLTLGVHAAGRRAYGRFTANRAGLPASWRWKWTLSTIAMTFVLFAAGISLIGLTHQVAWLATADEPVTSEVYGGYVVGDARNTLEQIVLGVHNYADTYGSPPSGGTFDALGVGLHSWETRILVFVGYQSPMNLDLPWRHPENESHFRSVLPHFLNSEFRVEDVLDDEGFGLSHFASNVRVLGPNLAMKFDEITDGTTNTLLVGEVNTGFRPWGDPVNWRDPAAGIGEAADLFGGPPGTGGATFLMADGSVRFVGEGTDPGVLKALATPAGGDGPSDAE